MRPLFGSCINLRRETIFKLSDARLFVFTLLAIALHAVFFTLFNVEFLKEDLKQTYPPTIRVGKIDQIAQVHVLPQKSQIHLPPCPKITMITLPPSHLPHWNITEEISLFLPIEKEEVYAEGVPLLPLNEQRNGPPIPHFTFAKEMI